MLTNTVERPAATAAGPPAYAGTWGKEQATHLLRRTLFGPKKSEITAAAAAGLEGTLDLLLAAPTLPPPPVNHEFTDDPNVPIGATWVEAPHLENADVGQYRWPSLRGWYFQTVIESPTNIAEKMAMFWINHFGMADVGEHRAQYQYLQMFREYGLGNFREMIERITVHPAMLKFLNGRYNNKWNPDENYSREILELFTVQKGPQVGPGDYTHYTEQDVRVGARIFTGWRVRGFWSSADEPVESYFDANWHDDDDGTPKQLSHRFDNQVIASNGEQEYKDYIAVIFTRPEVARAFCRELYRFFVYYEITAEVEQTVIEPLAQLMIAEDFAVRPTLRALLASQHFYDMAVRGPQIKSPYDFVFGIVRSLGGYGHLGLALAQTGNEPLLKTKYGIGTSLHWWANNMDMDFLYPPSVSGWKAYYQSPSFYRNWIGSATLQQRRKLVLNMTNRGVWTQSEDGSYDPRPFDWLAFLDQLESPNDPNEVVLECVELFLPRPLHPDQLDALKAELLGSLPDMEWFRQYANYQASPNNPEVANPIRDRVKRLFQALFSMAEFHLQ